jgi:hypothetical protein
MNWFFCCNELPELSRVTPEPARTCLNKNRFIELFDFYSNKIPESSNTLFDNPNKNIDINARIADNEYITITLGPLQKYLNMEFIYLREVLSSECKLKEYSNPKSVIIHIYPNKKPIYSLYTGNASCILYDLQI